MTEEENEEKGEIWRTIGGEGEMEDANKIMSTGRYTNVSTGENLSYFGTVMWTIGSGKECREK